MRRLALPLLGHSQVVTLSSLIIMGKPPALPGDPSSLTFPASDDDPSVLLQRSCSAWKERQPDIVDQQLQMFQINRGLSAGLNRLRIGPFEGPAIESPRLCRGILTLACRMSISFQGDSPCVEFLMQSKLTLKTANQHE
jgi:hypothetical protein